MCDIHQWLNSTWWLIYRVGFLSEKAPIYPLTIRWVMDVVFQMDLFGEAKFRLGWDQYNEMGEDIRTASVWTSWVGATSGGSISSFFQFVRYWESATRRPIPAIAAPFAHLFGLVNQGRNGSFLFWFEFIHQPHTRPWSSCLAIRMTKGGFSTGKSAMLRPDLGPHNPILATEPPLILERVYVCNSCTTQDLA